VTAALALTAAWVASQMAGTLARGEASREFADVSIDTRTLKAGDLFVAIQGERFDGSEFAGNAIESGAAGVVVPRGWAGRKAQGQIGRASCRERV